MPSRLEAIIRSLTRRRRVALALWVALLCWAATILALSSLTPDELPGPAFWFWDKLNHVLAFAVGGWLAARALRLSRPDLPVAPVLVAAVVMIAAFGALDETIQTLTPGRNGGDSRDWFADVIGAIGGAMLSLYRAPRLPRRPPD